MHQLFQQTELLLEISGDALKVLMLLKWSLGL